LTENEQGRCYAAHPKHGKHGSDPLDPSPSPPIGFQVFHDLIRHLMLQRASMREEFIDESLARIESKGYSAQRPPAIAHASSSLTLWEGPVSG
jgi:hypothetical protein